MSTIFLSYSHSDSKTADEIGELLESFNIDYFRDIKNIDLGDPITETVRQALKDCRAILVIVSPGSLRSDWVPYEIGHAAGLSKKIIPYLTHPEIEVPHYIRDLSYATTIERLREYFENQFADDLASSEFTYDHACTTNFAKMQNAMPELLREMKDDLLGDDATLVREFFVLPSRTVTVNGTRQRFAYYEDEHDQLSNKCDLLEAHDFVDDVTVDNTPIYRMSEPFVDLLKAMGDLTIAWKT